MALGRLLAASMLSALIPAGQIFTTDLLEACEIQKHISRVKLTKCSVVGQAFPKLWMPDVYSRNKSIGYQAASGILVITAYVCHRYLSIIVL